MRLLCFVFGAAIGSFLNVLAVRYNPDKFLLAKKVIGGRSRCPHCGKILRWFELVPILSFIRQGGQCRNCGEKINVQYPVVEILSGLIFVFVPFRLAPYFYLLPTTYYLLVSFWILAFLAILLVSLIDLRLNIIPDELNFFLAILGIGFVFLSSGFFDLWNGSFPGNYAGLFGWLGNVWANHIFALIAAGVFFLALIFLTKGKGMGGGDLKLAMALGFLFGWPDAMMVIFIAFVLGAAAGVILMAVKMKKLKSFLPFGPFLGAASAIVFFFGHSLLELYFNLFGF